MKGTINNRVLLGSIEVLRKVKQVEIVQSLKKLFNP